MNNFVTPYAIAIHLNQDFFLLQLFQYLHPFPERTQNSYVFPNKRSYIFFCSILIFEKPFKSFSF